MRSKEAPLLHLQRHVGAVVENIYCGEKIGVSSKTVTAWPGDATCGNCLSVKSREDAATQVVEDVRTALGVDAELPWVRRVP